MSKAFVKEHDGGEDEDDIKGSFPEVPAGFKNYITLQGYQRLKQELLTLIDCDRVEVVKLVSWAASNGDRSENGDYIYGKRRLREIDRRIRFLTKRIESAEVVDIRLQQHLEQVFFGATVEYLNSAQETHKIKIVGVDEVDLEKGHVSWISPIARALLKMKEGDVVNLITPSGKDVLEILSVCYKVDE